MSRSALLTRTASLLVLGVTLAAPVHAEGNRLLPFWGQPYPYGYAWTDRQDAVPRAQAHGADRCRNGRRRGHARSRIVRCGGVVLHARD